MMERSVRTLPLRSGLAATGWFVAAIMAALLLAYANSFPGAFFFDDDAAIVHNASIRDLTAWRQVLWPPVEAGIGGRPFANLTFALNYALGGYDPTGYHAVNLVIHVGATLLLFGLTRRTLLLPAMRGRFGTHATEAAFFVALLWGLHPLQTNIVDYMSQRTEGLMALLYVLTLYAFVRSTGPADGRTVSPATSRRWAVVAVLASALGMSTKEGMVTAPLMALLYDRTFISGGFLEAIRRHGKTLGGLAATWLLLAGLMATSKLSARGVGFDLNISPFVYAMTEVRSIVQYLQLSIWPSPLVFDYGTGFYIHHLPEALPSAAVLLLALAATGYAVWRLPPVGFAAAWFFILLSPSSSVIPVAQQPCAENRVYLPLAGVAALIVVVAYRLLQRRAGVTLALVAVGLACMTFARNPVFGSELAVWWDSVAKRPTNARAENNLGNALLKTGRTDEAMQHFDAALAREPRYADAHNNRGVTLLRQHRPQDAVAEFRQAIDAKDHYADAYYNLGEAYLQMGANEEAVGPLQTALKIDPRNPKAHNNLGIALLNLGRVEESIAEERAALALDDTMPEAHYNLGNSLAKAGDVTGALSEFDLTLQIDPKFAKAHNNAGVLLLRMGRKEEAAARFEAALRIDPAYPEAKRNLELVRASPPVPTATVAQP